MHEIGEHTEVVICRHPTSGTTAHGGDELAVQLLRRAGFDWQRFFAPYYRLNYDLPPAEQEAKATDAARMLRACHYRVHLAPDLDLDLAADQRAVPVVCPVHPGDPAGPADEC